MSRKCDICGKQPMFGHNVSHAHNKTRKIQLPNVQKVRIRLENGSTKIANVCTKCLRSGKVVKAL